MAKTKTRPRPKKVAETMDEVAERAAKLAVQETENQILKEDEPDLFDMQTVDDDFDDLSADHVVERDIFQDAFKKAFAKNDSVRFYIYKNSTFTTIKNHPYNWERLQKDFGEGHYKVVAKSVKTGQNVMTQSELVGDPTPISEQNHKTEHEEIPYPQPMDPLALVTLMQASQDKAEQKVAQQAQIQQTGMTAMMTTMMQMQQQAQQQFQMMVLEMQKQSQAQAQAQQNLILSMLQTKPAADSGFTAATVMKMVQDERRDSEARTKQWYELVEKKAEALASEKAEAMNAGSDSEDSLGKTLVKNFVPVLGQILAAQQGQAQPPQQMPPQQRPIGVNGAGAVANPRAQIPSVPKDVRIQHERQAQAPAKVANPDPAPKSPVSNGFPTRAEKVPTAQAIKQKPASPQNRTPEREMMSREESQAKIFEIVAADIGQALLLRTPASKVGEASLKKLEKNGVTRQNVLDAFTLEDFYALARANGLPDIAKPWIKEFYEFIAQKEVKTLRGAAGSQASVQP